MVRPFRRTWGAIASLRIARAAIAAIAVAAPTPPIAAAAAPLRCDAPLAGAPAAAIDADYGDLLRLADGWTVRQRVSHLFVLGVPGTTLTEAVRTRIEEDAPAGVFLLGRNAQARDQLAGLVDDVRDVSRATSGGVEPFIATDFEGGTVNALRAITGPTPSAQQLAASGETGALTRGAADAAVLRTLGINVNLAPVADIRPTDGGFIGSRSFAANAATVASLATAYARGLRAGGIVPVLKHFPGHGRAVGDSHVLLPVLSHDRDVLREEDVRPFADALRTGEPGMVMVGHVLVPAIDPVSPASLSGAVIDGLLRRDLGFDGVVITDEMKMGAVTGKRNVVEGAMAAIQAGADLVLADYSPSEHASVVDALVDACDRGTLSGDRLASALARVLHLKSSFGLMSPEASRRLEAWRAERTTGSRPVWLAASGPAGRFFPAPVAVGPPGPDAGAAPGFTITDEQGIMLYRDYVNLGGAARLGRPLSRRFLLDGQVVQLLEGGLLRWRPDSGDCDLFDGFETFVAAGVPRAVTDAWLRANGWGTGGGEPVRHDRLPDLDPVLGAATGPATRHGDWVSRTYVRGAARVPGTGGQSPSREVILVGGIARAIDAFPVEAITPLPMADVPNPG